MFEFDVCNVFLAWLTDRSQKSFISITAELHETWLCEVRHHKCTKIQTGVSDHVFIELQKLFHKLRWTLWRRLSVSTSLVNTPQVEFTSSKVWTNIWNCSANVPQCCQDFNLKKQINTFDGLHSFLEQNQTGWSHFDFEEHEKAAGGAAFGRRHCFLPPPSARGPEAASGCLWLYTLNGSKYVGVCQ